MKNYWEKLHQIYSKKDWLNNPTIFANFAIKYLPKRGKILDLGAGQGQDSRFFARLGYRVTSTDISSLGLQLSQKKAKEEGLNIEFEELDISNKLPYENNSFDIVYSHLALHYFSDEKTRSIFAEINRVLKPGGLIASIFNSVDDSEYIDKEYKKLDKDFYQDDYGMTKRFFSVDYVEVIARNLFDIIHLDNRGESYNKIHVKTLVRFVGRVKK